MAALLAGLSAPPVFAEESDVVEVTGLLNVPDGTAAHAELGADAGPATTGGAFSPHCRLVPTTVQHHVELRAQLESGEVVTGENEIARHPTSIHRLSLVPSPRPTPEVMQALVSAQAVVVGPGDLYTEILPSLLVEGVSATIYGIDAVRIYVANMRPEPGETDRLTIDDHLRIIRAHSRFELFDYILVNRPMEALGSAVRSLTRAGRSFAAPLAARAV